MTIEPVSRARQRFGRRVSGIRGNGAGHAGRPGSRWAIGVGALACVLGLVSPGSAVALPGWSGSVLSYAQSYGGGGFGFSNAGLQFNGTAGDIRHEGEAEYWDQPFQWEETYVANQGPHAAECPPGEPFGGWRVKGVKSGYAAGPPGQYATIRVTTEGPPFGVNVYANIQEGETFIRHWDCGAEEAIAAPPGWTPTNQYSACFNAMSTADRNNIHGTFTGGNGSEVCKVSLTREPDADGDGRPDEGPPGTRDECTDVYAPADTNGCPADPPNPPLAPPEQPGGGNPTQPPASSSAPDRAQTCHPCDASTGDFWHTFNDLSVSGRGIPLNLTRTYHSLFASTDGPFGFGWVSRYTMGLSFPDPAHVVVSQENGSEVYFHEQADKSYAAAPRVMASLVHNGGGSWTFRRRSKDSFDFNAGGKLTQVKDLNGETTSLSYNGEGQLSAVTDAAGRKLTFAYSGSHIGSATDPLGRVVKYAYDGAGNLADVTDVAKGNTHFTYDLAHQMLSMRLPNQAPGVPGATGAVVSNTYDAQGQVSSQSDQLGRKTTFGYTGDNFSAEGGTVTVTDPKGNVVVEEYKLGQLLSKTKGFGTPEAATWKFAYDPNTFGITTMTDPNGHTTRETFDAAGNVLTNADGLGRTTTNTYDALNDLLATKDPLGVTTSMTYDSRGNLLTRSRPLTGTSEVQTTTYLHEDSSHPGDLTAIKDPGGNVSKYTYDANGDRASSTDPLGNKTSSTYNSIGWRLTSISPKGAGGGTIAAKYTTSFSYNEFGQVTKTADPLKHATTNQYDPNRNLTATTDANGNKTTYSYDAEDERTATHRPDGTTTQTAYWPDGTVKDQIDGAGHMTHYDYDSLARRTQVTDPLGKVTKYAYDGAGNQTSMTDPQGQTTARTYDDGNQLTAISYSDGATPNVTGITYDGDGQRTAMKDGTGNSSWEWDSLHRLKSTTNGAGTTIRYSYDLRDLPTQITYPGALAVTRGYDAAGRWTSLTDWKANKTAFSYDVNSNLTKESLPTSTKVVDTLTYDHADQLTALKDKHGTTVIYAAKYKRDKDGQLASDSSVPAAVGKYKYTTLNQLCYAGSVNTAACSSPPSGSQAYGFNPADNLTTNNGNAQQFNAADELCWATSGASSNACSSPPSSATSFTYDERGNRTASVTSANAGTCYAYDQANRLTSISKGTGSSCSGPTTVGTYAYDGLGLRQSKNVSGATTQFTWDVSSGLPLLVQERVGSANPASYIYGPGGHVLEQVDPSGNVHYYHYDQLGSTRAVTGSSGTIEATYTYDPYGNVTGSTNPGGITNPLQFAGEYRDSESGLSYLRARYYDSKSAQFITRDPLVEVTWSPYAYVIGNPTTFQDPLGLIFGITWGHVSAVSGIIATGAALTGLEPVALVAGAVSLASGADQTVNDVVRDCASSTTIALDVAGLVPGLGSEAAAVRAARTSSMLARAGETTRVAFNSGGPWEEFLRDEQMVRTQWENEDTAANALGFAANSAAAGGAVASPSGSGCGCNR